jgi:hypothetical protein
MNPTVKALSVGFIYPLGKLFFFMAARRASVFNLFENLA